MSFAPIIAVCCSLCWMVMRARLKKFIVCILQQPDLFGEEDASGFVATSRHGHAALFQIPDVVPPDGFRNELTVSRCAALKSTPHHVVYLSKAAVERQSVRLEFLCTVGIAVHRSHRCMTRRSSLSSRNAIRLLTMHRTTQSRYLKAWFVDA